MLFIAFPNCIANCISSAKILGFKMFRLWVYCVFVLPHYYYFKKHHKGLTCGLLFAGVSSQIDEQFTAGEPKYPKIDVRAHSGSRVWVLGGAVLVQNPPQHTHRSIQRTLSSLCLSLYHSLPPPLSFHLFTHQHQR